LPKYTSARRPLKLVHSFTRKFTNLPQKIDSFLSSKLSLYRNKVCREARWIWSRNSSTHSSTHMRFQKSWVSACPTSCKKLLLSRISCRESFDRRGTPQIYANGRTIHARGLTRYCLLPPLYLYGTARTLSATGAGVRGNTDQISFGTFYFWNFTDNPILIEILIWSALLIWFCFLLNKQGRKMSYFLFAINSTNSTLVLSAKTNADKIRGLEPVEPLPPITLDLGPEGLTFNFPIVLDRLRMTAPERVKKRHHVDHHGFRCYDEVSCLPGSLGNFLHTTRYCKRSTIAFWSLSNSRTYPQTS
jgi:hypothetical protein